MYPVGGWDSTIGLVLHQYKTQILGSVEDAMTNENTSLNGQPEDPHISDQERLAAQRRANQAEIHDYLAKFSDRALVAKCVTLLQEYYSLRLDEPALPKPGSYKGIFIDDKLVEKSPAQIIAHLMNVDGATVSAFKNPNRPNASGEKKFAAIFFEQWGIFEGASIVPCLPGDPPVTLEEIFAAPAERGGIDWKMDSRPISMTLTAQEFQVVGHLLLAVLAHLKHPPASRDVPRERFDPDTIQHLVTISAQFTRALALATDGQEDQAPTSLDLFTFMQAHAFGNLVFHKLSTSTAKGRWPYERPFPVQYPEGTQGTPPG